MRIVGVNLPINKRVEAALPYIYGIGLTKSKEILSACGISGDVRVKDLDSVSVGKLQDYITKNYRVEGDLRKEVAMNIARLREINSYRGLRHKKSLPVRGQRTKTNARTRKGNIRSSSKKATK